LKKPAWLEKLLLDHWLTVQSVSSSLVRFPTGETWKKTPALLKLRRYLNAKRALQAVERGQAKVTTFPTYLTIDPFSACNLRCPLCATGNGSNTLKKGLLQVDMFRHIVDEMGTYLYNIDLFNWGEPLLNKDIYEMIAYAHKRHILTSISSNFHFFDEAAAAKMVNSGLDYLILSIDGATQETYEKYRVGGDLEVVLNNVRTLVETRKRLGKKTPYIFWQFLVFRHNEHEIEQARDLALGLGVDEFKTEYAYLPFATREEGERWIPRQEQYTRYSLKELEVIWATKEVEERERAAREAAEQERMLEERAREARAANERLRQERNGGAATSAMPGRGPGAALELLPAKPEPVVVAAPLRRRLANCSWLYITTTVNADGKVYPCCVTTQKEDMIGDLKKSDGITTLWNSETYQAARLYSTREIETGIETVCHRCPLAPAPGQIG